MTDTRWCCLQIVEECDDGNAVGGDGCSGECKIEPGYMCALSPEKGTSSCKEVVCGDGIRMNSQDGSKREACDDGNTAAVSEPPHQILRSDDHHR